MSAQGKSYVTVNNSSEGSLKMEIKTNHVSNKLYIQILIV